MTLQEAIKNGWIFQLERGLVVAEKDRPGSRTTDQYVQHVRSGTYEDGLTKVLDAIGRFEADRAALPLEFA